MPYLNSPSHGRHVRQSSDTEVRKTIDRRAAAPLQSSSAGGQGLPCHRVSIPSQRQERDRAQDDGRGQTEGGKYIDMVDDGGEARTTSPCLGGPNQRIRLNSISPSPGRTLVRRGQAGIIGACDIPACLQSFQWPSLLPPKQHVRPTWMGPGMWGPQTCFSFCRLGDPAHARRTWTTRVTWACLTCCCSCRLGADAPHSSSARAAWTPDVQRSPRPSVPSRAVFFSGLKRRVRREHAELGSLARAALRTERVSRLTSLRVRRRAAPTRGPASNARPNYARSDDAPRGTGTRFQGRPLSCQSPPLHHQSPTVESCPASFLATRSFPSPSANPGDENNASGRSIHRAR